MKARAKARLGRFVAHPASAGEGVGAGCVEEEGAIALQAHALFGPVRGM
jgi:hypothetical protein